MKQSGRLFTSICLAGLCFAMGIGSPVSASQGERLPENSETVELTLTPSEISLAGPFSYRQLLVTATLTNGDRIDVTRIADVKAPEELVTVDDYRLIRPVGDGQGNITFSVGGKQATIPVTVSGQQQAPNVSFVQDVMPALSKMGCNAGTCHGAQQGKNGFKLSLRGYDPLFDHRALTDDLEGRRFNRAAPERSLMLSKFSGEVPHVGGVLAEPGSRNYELVRAWIADGVKLDLESPRVDSITVAPQEPVIPLPGMKQQMLVMATFTDGTVRDVTAEAFIESSNTETATVDSRGLVTAVRRGEAAMLARYEGRYAATTLVVMGDRSGYEPKSIPTDNFIDELVYKKLERMKIVPSDLCSDNEFVRRVYLDLTGLPPQPEEVRQFLNDSRPSKQKREELIDRLVGSYEYVEFWTNKWADLLQVNRKYLGERGAWAFRNWIRQAIASNVPYNEFAFQILNSSGSTLANPPAAYYKILRDPADVMENTTQLFLAIRFNCNKCHDHPFERWNQDQYYELAAYFSQVGRKADPNHPGMIGGTAVEGGKPVVEIVYDTNSGEVVNERTGQNAQAAFPYQHEGMPGNSGTRREQLARWITSAENPYFAKSYVNRVWSYLLGVGFIEPVDDIRAGNPPTNPELLDRLTEEFIASGWDVQQLMRTICKTRVYQHSVVTNKWNEDDEINYSHALARRLPAETLYDAIHRALGSSPDLPGLPADFRAAQLVDSNVKLPGEFLDLFGKPSRESACECERSSGMMLGPVLNLVNGPVIAEAIRDPNNRVAKLVNTVEDDAKLIEEIFISLLCRKPSKIELAAGLDSLRLAAEELTRLRQDLEKFEKQDLPARQAQWEKDASETVVWHPLTVVEAKSDKGATLEPQDDQSIFVTGPNPSPIVYTVTARTDLKRITAVRLEVLADNRLPAKGPGRAPNGNFVLSELGLSVGKPGEDHTPASFGETSADFSQDGWPVAAAVDGNPQSGWAVSPQFGTNHTAIFALREGATLADDSTLTFTFDQRYPGKDHNIGKFRLAVTDAKYPMRQDNIPEAIKQILTIASKDRSPEQAKQLADHYRSIDQEYQRLSRAVAEFQERGGPRLIGSQDLAWALINSPAFLFNH